MDDCLVVGAGVVGLSIAYELAHHGLQVRVIDRGEPGREASWAGAGILPPANAETAEHPHEKLRGISHQLHREWAQRLFNETGIDTGYRRCGGIYLARSAGEAASLAGLAKLLRTLHVEVERLALESVVDLESALKPLVDSGHLRSAYLLPDEAQLRNPRHVQALVAACGRRGVAIQTNTPLTDISCRAGRIESVRTAVGDLLADRYCLCSGAWTFEILRRLGFSTGILPVRGQIVLFRCPTRPFLRVLNEGSRYLVPRDDGRVLAGSTEEEVGFDKSTTPEAIRELCQFAYDLVPGLRLAEIEQTWAGLRPGSFDGFPYLGSIPGLENAFVAAGHFRSGLQLSPATAVVMGQVIRGEPSMVDLTPFRVGRG